MRNCKHGFNPLDGPGLWCPACDKEIQAKAQRHAMLHELPWWRRVMAWFGWW